MWKQSEEITYKMNTPFIEKKIIKVNGNKVGEIRWTYDDFGNILTEKAAPYSATEFLGKTGSRGLLLVSVSAWPCRTACRILVPQTGIEVKPSAMKAWSPNHWTAREFPSISALVKEDKSIDF